MSKVTETAKKILDPEKIKKNTFDVLGFILGLSGGLIVSSVQKKFMKLPSAAEPFVTFAPGIAGAILLDDPFQRSIAKGVAAVGGMDGINKAVNAMDFLSFAKPYAPKVVPSDATVSGLRGLGALPAENVLLGLSGGSMTQVPAWM